jgi:hypothetical protein
MCKTLLSQVDNGVRDPSLDVEVVRKNCQVFSKASNKSPAFADALGFAHVLLVPAHAREMALGRMEAMWPSPCS